jgi:putative molybdopterin biosynthesis protein
MAHSTLAHLDTFEQIKLLADRRRLAILRRLMAGPASLTQLGRLLGEHPAWVRHHLVRLQQAGLVEITETRTVHGATEKFYRANADAFIFQELILPEPGSVPFSLFSGSHDLAVELLAGQLEKYLHIQILPVGSLDGLIALRQGLAHLSGCHLLDPGGEYNLPYVRHLFPDRSVCLFTLAEREQGLLLAPGNPKGIRNLADLAREDMSFINRNPGSGTRIWLDQQLLYQGIPASRLKGYDRTVSTHTECARLIQAGQADAAVGLHAAAARFGLEFIPLFQERYDLIIPQAQVERLHPLLDTLQTRRFRAAARALPGYNLTHTGESISL